MRTEQDRSVDMTGIRREHIFAPGRLFASSLGYFAPEMMLRRLFGGSSFTAIHRPDLKAFSKASDRRRP
jgi:hypothetical protein